MYDFKSTQGYQSLPLKGSTERLNIQPENEKVIFLQLFNVSTDWYQRDQIPSAFHMFLTKLPRLTEDLGASTGTSQLTLSIYMATFAFVRMG